MAEEELTALPQQDTISRARTLAAIRDAMSIILGGPVYTGLDMAYKIVARQEAVKDER